MNIVCPNCGGSGRVVTSDKFKVFERLQDEDLGCVAEFEFLPLAECYVAERQLMPLGTCSMFHIACPSGEVVRA